MSESRIRFMILIEYCYCYHYLFTYRLLVYNFPQVALDTFENNNSNNITNVKNNDNKKSLCPALILPLGEPIYSCCWSPTMNAITHFNDNKSNHSNDNDRKSQCLFAVACRGRPIHLYDAIQGTSVASYSVYNQKVKK